MESASMAASGASSSRHLVSKGEREVGRGALGETEGPGACSALRPDRVVAFGASLRGELGHRPGVVFERPRKVAAVLQRFHEAGGITSACGVERRRETIFQEPEVIGRPFAWRPVRAEVMGDLAAGVSVAFGGAVGGREPRGPVPLMPPKL